MLKKKFIAIFIAVCWTTLLVNVSDAGELSAKEIMTQVWSQQYPENLKTEVFFGREEGTDGRDVGAWIDHENGQALICIGHYNNSKKSFVGLSGCTLYEADESDFGYSVYVTMNTGRRAKIKEKVGGYDSLANQTQMNYFDIVRSLFREKSENFDFSFIDLGNSTKIKVVPRDIIKGDYLFRIFYIDLMKDGAFVIAKVEYYKYPETENGPDKTRENSDFKLYEVDGVNVWRPEKAWIFTSTGSTEIKFIKREFNLNFGKLSKKDLKKGRPPKWRD